MTFLLQFRRLYVDNLIKQPRQTKKDIIEQDMKRLTEMMKTFFRHEPERLVELKTITDTQDWSKLQQLSDSALSAHQHTVYEGKKAEILSIQEEKLLQLEVNYQKSVETWDYDLISTAVEKTSVFQIIRYIREKVEPKDKVLHLSCLLWHLKNSSGRYCSLFKCSNSVLNHYRNGAISERRWIASKRW